jgi:hypothetical protein
MASVKAVKITGAAAKEPAPKLSETATKPSAAKNGVKKKAEQKPREPKKKVYTYIALYLSRLVLVAVYLCSFSVMITT